MSRPRVALFFAGLLAATLVPAVASAQTVSASGQKYPIRLRPDGSSACSGTDSSACTSTRPQNLNPLGISYQDCIDDLTLRFSVTLSQFAGADSLQVWGSLTSDCTSATDRGVGAGVQALCWGLRSNNIVNPIISTPQSYTFDVRVQDLVGWQQSLPTASEAASPPRKGQEACSAQATFGAVPININFLAINSSSTSDGTPYQYQINTDMVGPPAPSNVTETVGDTIFNISWNANSDSDTAGYDIFIDPIPGQESGEAGVALEAGQVLICPDTGAVSTLDATATESGATDGPLESSAEGSVEASVPEASTPAPYDGGCYYVNRGGVPPTSANGYNCNDSILSSAILQDGGAGNVGEGGTSTTTSTFDDAGNLIEGGGSVNEGSGGISTIPLAYLYGASSGFTIADKANGQYTIKGLADGTGCPGAGCYTVVVAAVDGTGNIGPPSLQVCDYPAPVRDFWQSYEQDGGKGAGFCALETIGAGGPSLAGVACVLGAAAIARRRRRSGK